MGALANVRSAMSRAAVPPTRRAAGARTGVARRIAALLCALGLFTVSWERLGNIGAGGYNVKLPVLLFLAAAVLASPGWAGWLRGVPSLSPATRWIVVGAGAAVVLYAVRALTSSPLAPGLAQLAAVLTGAVLPALALVGVVARPDVAWALKWFVAGAVVAGTFGLYQLVAFYLGLPQGVEYTGVGTSGAGGRISSFSYEPAYFAAYLVLAVGAVIATAQLSGRRVSWPAIVFFGLLLTLVNVRALLFVLPVAAVLLAIAWRRNRLLLLKGAAAGILLVAATTFVGTVASSVVASAPTATPSVAAPTATTEPSPVPAPPRLPTDVLDPNEVSSNGPRLDLYKAVLRVDLQHSLAGVGPGHLRDALATDGYVAPNQGVNVVANNIWLQAVADGGLLLLVLEGASITAAVVLWWRTRRTPAHPLLSTWLAVVLVAGMLTSYYFDIKVWVVVALALALVPSAVSHVGGSTPSPEAGRPR